MHIALSRVFGGLETSATHSMNDDHNPFLLVIEYDPQNPLHRARQHFRTGGIDRAGWIGWHWDQAFMPEIVRGAALRMLKPAQKMGETGFVDAAAAYDRLPHRLKKEIDGLEVVYEFDYYGTDQFGFPSDLEAIPGSQFFQDVQYPPVVHPLVTEHPDLGRKVLKLSPMHSRYVLGMDRAESDQLLAHLAAHLIDPDYAYFHPWKENDIIVWDNWRVIHGANGIPLDCSRKAVRTTITGDYKVGRLLSPSAMQSPTQRFLD